MNKMTPDFPFEPFPKVPRLMKPVVYTEKLDGTNAGVYIPDINPDNLIYASSRNRWITPDNDNYGFARWVQQNKEELLAELGPGMHFGEWWGIGIQRGYDLYERRFSLFNTHRWADNIKPGSCFGCVPLLGIRNSFYNEDLDTYIMSLLAQGSVAAPGYMNPEGIMVFHTASNQVFKWTFDGDNHKGVVDEDR